MADLGAIGSDVNSTASTLLSVTAANLVVRGMSVPTAPTAAAIDLGNLKSIRGFCKDASGNPIARLVLCIRHDTKEVVDWTTSNASTGAFEVRPPDTGLCHVLHVPDVGDSRNGVVLTGLTPVAPL
jgi:hypothetical protein